MMKKIEDQKNHNLETQDSIDSDISPDKNDFDNNTYQQIQSVQEGADHGFKPSQEH